MVSVLLPSTVPLHGILCHSHSDINRNLIASSELWKLICFPSINELNTSVVFCYFHLPTINTILVINKLKHLSYYWQKRLRWFEHIVRRDEEVEIKKVFELKVLSYVFYSIFILCLVYYVSPLCIYIVIVTCSIYNGHQNCKALRAFLG